MTSASYAARSRGSTLRDGVGSVRGLAVDVRREGGSGEGGAERVGAEDVGGGLSFLAYKSLRAR